MARRKNENDIQVELRENEVVSLCNTLSSIPDRRAVKKPLYPFSVVITMLIYATLCGYTGKTGSERFCKLHADFFKKVFDLKSTPSTTVFTKALEVLDQEEVAKLLASWVKTCSQDVKEKYESIRAMKAYEREERESTEKLNAELRDVEVRSLIDALNMVPDYRKARGIRYPLVALILMLIYAALCGYTKSTDIANYCRGEAEYFTMMFDLNRTPSHDTFDRLKALLNPDKLSIPLEAWIRTCYPDTKSKFRNMHILHIDGKAILAATAKQKGEKSRYVLNAMYEGEFIRLTTREVGIKNNEAGEIINFIKLFNINNTIVTGDAAFLTGKLVKTITDEGGFLVIPIKGNQGILEERTIEVCNKLMNTPASNLCPGVSTMFDELEHVVYKPKKQHGREEVVTCTLIDAKVVLIEELLNKKPWLNSATYIAVIDKTTTKIVKGEKVTTKGRRLFLTTLNDVTPDDIRIIVAGHWNIEAAHWLLDIHLREDSNTAKAGYAMKFDAMLCRLPGQLWKASRGTSKITLRTFILDNRTSTENIEQLLARSVGPSEPAA